MDEDIVIEKPVDVMIRNYIPHHGVKGKKYRIFSTCNILTKSPSSINDKSAVGLRILSNI